MCVVEICSAHSTGAALFASALALDCSCGGSKFMHRTQGLYTSDICVQIAIILSDFRLNTTFIGVHSEEDRLGEWIKEV